MSGAPAPDIAAPDSHAGIGFREFVCIVAAIMAIMGLGLDTMLAALPEIGRSLGIADENRRQWIIGAYLLGFGPAQIVYGPLSDRFGRKPLMLGGIVGYALCCIGIVAATSFSTVIALRVLQGGSIAATRVVSTSMVRDCYSGRQMARVMSLAMILFLAVPILAPSIGQLLMLVFPWRGLFAALAAMAAILFAWVALRLPETLHPDYHRPISPHVVFGGIRTALSNRQAFGYMIIQALLQGALYGFVNSVQQIFADVFHAARMMPTIFAAIAGMTGISSLLNARIVERLGTRRVSHTAIIGFTLIETLHLIVALCGIETIWSFALCQACAMFFFGLSMGNFGAIAIEPLAALAGTAASVQGFVVVLGGTLIGLAIGQAFDGSTIPMTGGFVTAGILSIVLILWTERGRLFHPLMGA